jgi:hypothetical protein
MGQAGLTDKPLALAAFTGGPAVPSARFRLRQYIDALGATGIQVAESWPGLGSYPPASRWLRPAWLAGTLIQRLPAVLSGRTADVTFLQREFVSTLATLEGWTKRPRLLDVDDAIHLFRHGRAARRLGGQADLVVAGNAWLAESWSAWAPRVAILPTAVDIPPGPPTPPPEMPRIGWIGTSGNLRYLESIAAPLSAVLGRFPGTRLAVCCDRRPVLGGLPLEFVPWAPGIERSFLESLSIGLMPLAGTDWERGKCSFKLLQYMAAGRPAVVSPVGMNNEILAQDTVAMAAGDEGQWIEGLSALLADPTAAAAMGARGRALAQMRYSVGVVAPLLAALIRGVV